MKKYKCIKSYDGTDIGTLYDENDKPYWFKNYNSIKNFIETSTRYGQTYFEEITSSTELASLPVRKSLVFKKGIWYKYHSARFYMHCSKDAIDKLFYDKYIEVSTGYIGKDNSSYSNQYITDEEVPLSEIEKYIPNKEKEEISSGAIHRDNLIKNEFYVGNWSPNGKVIFQFSGDLKECNHLIQTNGKYDYDSCCTASDIIFRQATKEEKELLICKIPKETMKEQINFIHGEYYVDRVNSGGIRIFKYNKPNQQLYYINTAVECFFIYNHDSTVEIDSVPATQKEIDWLNKCIKANKFVSEDYFVELTSLPEKWCVKPRTSKEADEIFTYKGISEYSDSKSLEYYQHYPSFTSCCTASSTIQDGYTEITYEQFKKWVMKEEEPDMQEILKQAIEKYPIGCKYKPIGEDGHLSSVVHTQVRECYIYNSYGDKWIIGSANIRNPKGQWAEIISLPVTNSIEEWVPQEGEWCYYGGKEAGGLDTGPGHWEKGVIAKFSHTSSTSWHFSETSQSRMKNCSNVSCAFRKATPEEVEGYLKIIKTPIIETKEEEFKIGDWVYAEKGDWSSECRKSEHIPCFKLEGFDPGGTWARPIANLPSGVKKSLLRKALPHEIPNTAYISSSKEAYYVGQPLIDINWPDKNLCLYSSPSETSRKVNGYNFVKKYDRVKIESRNILAIENGFIKLTTWDKCWVKISDIEGNSPLEQVKEHYNETINSSTNVEYSTKGALPLYNVKKRLVLN